MLICGSSMFEFIVSKNMKKRYNKGSGDRENSGTFMPTTYCQGIEN